MLSWVDEQIRAELRKDMLREAEHERLVAAVLSAKPKTRRFYWPVIAQLGGWLVAFGASLEARYGTIVERPVTATINDSRISCSSGR